MKLTDIPNPVWYALLGVAAVGGVYWLSKRAAGAVGDVVRDAGAAANKYLNPMSDENVAYAGVNGALRSIGLFGEDDTVGTWAYDAAQDGNSPIGWLQERYRDDDGSTNWWQLYKDSTGISLIGAAARGIYDMEFGWAGEPSSSGSSYDYGQGGDSGIPYRPGIFSTPDPFNYSLDYILGAK